MPTKAQPSHGCTQLAAVDLDAGKKLWTRTIKSGDQPINFDNVTISGNTVAAGSTGGGAAFDISTGKALWAPKTGDSCYDSGYGGGEKLVAVRKCGYVRQYAPAAHPDHRPEVRDGDLRVQDAARHRVRQRRLHRPAGRGGRRRRHRR